MGSVDLWGVVRCGPTCMGCNVNLWGGVWCGPVGCVWRISGPVVGLMMADQWNSLYVVSPQVPKWCRTLLTEEDRHGSTFKRPCASPGSTAAGQSSLSPPSKKRRMGDVRTCGTIVGWLSGV